MVLIFGTTINSIAFTDFANTKNVVEITSRGSIEPGSYIDQVFGHKATDRLIVSEFEFIADPREEGESKGLRFVKKNGRIVIRFAPTKTYGSPNWLGKASLLGKDSIQFFWSASTGVVCCANYRIFDIKQGTLREIFRGDQLSWLSDPVTLYDFDDDGVYEISQGVYDFRYFADMCGACSPQVNIVFKYDKKRAKYQPAILYTPDSYEYIEDTKLEIYAANLNEEPRTDYLSLHLSVLLGHIYAGEREKGWAFFNRQYVGTDKANRKRAIRKRLRESEVYRSIYK